MNRLVRKLLPLLVMLFIALPSNAQDSRHLIMIVDTSGSMKDNDPAKYSVQSVKILNDILPTGDQLSIIRFPASACPMNGENLTISRSEQNFARQIETHIDSGRGSHTSFEQPLRNAQRAIDIGRKDRNLLLVISDVGADNFKCGDERSILSTMPNNTHKASINIGEGNLNSENHFNSHFFAQDSPSLIKAIADVYQKFIGGVNSQNGKVSGQRFAFNIDSYVKNAYVVVAADGKVGEIKVTGETEASGSINENFKGGATTGKSGSAREYKILKLVHPTKGEWLVDLPDLSEAAGWMLIQEYSIGIRFTEPSIATVNEPLMLEAELFDEVSQQAMLISDEMHLSIEFENQIIDFSTINDKFTTQMTFPNKGEYILQARLKGGQIDKQSLVPVKVIQPEWQIVPDITPTVIADQETVVKVVLNQLQGNPKVPEIVTMTTPEGQIKLTRSNQTMTAFVYLGKWLPTITGAHNIRFSINDRFFTKAVSKPVTTEGYVIFGDVKPIHFGQLVRKQESQRILDLNVKTRGSPKIKLEVVMDKSNVALFRKIEGEWQEMDSRDTLTLSEQELAQWPIKLVTYSCPLGSTASDDLHLIASHTNHLGQVSSIQIPITANITPDHWFVCWWPRILLMILLLMVLKALHCYASTAKFPSQFGLLMSDENDLAKEGIFNAIRTYSGSKRRFCQDAYIYLHTNFRFTRKSEGAWLRLQARSQGVFILATGNDSVMYQRPGIDWEAMEPDVESPLRPGTTYKNSHDSIFFEAKYK